MTALATAPIVLGTAGHVDHGKTALVHALTGIDTDRLAVEKQRGITTELGFAHLDLAGRRYGVVDVPGHERFIRAMVAGAGGIDLVLLAIAADEGVMPQTREHLDICALLGVRRGIVVLTKSDLCDRDWLALVADDVRGALAGSAFAEAPMVPVSVRTGAGLDALRAEIVRQTEALDPRDDGGVFRMPLDRVFSIHGFGTVVTGAVAGGRVRVGDAVVVQPRGLTSKVRGLQRHGEAVDDAPAGARCAVNLAGLGVDKLARGDWLAHPGVLEPAHLLDVRVRCLPSTRTRLDRRSRVLLHHGTTQVAATLVLADRDHLAPGETGLAQLRLSRATPLVALPGDRFVARGTVVQDHYGTTIGGGEIVRIHAPKLRRAAADGRAMLARIAAAGPDERVALELRAADITGLLAGALTARLGLAPRERDARVDALIAGGDAVRLGEGEGARLWHAEPLARLEQRALERVVAAGSDGVGRAELLGQLPASTPARLMEAALAALARRGALVLDGDRVRPPQRAVPGHPRSLLAQQLERRMRDWSVAPPRPAAIADELAAAPALVTAALDELRAGGTVVRIKPDLFVHADALAALERALLAYLDAHGTIDTGAFKQLAGTSRKYAIPLAEYFDAAKVTLRVGDRRKRRG